MFTFLFACFVYFTFFGKVSADIPNPEFFTKHCNRFELEVQCSYSSDSSNLNCMFYRQNPNFRFLTADGHVSVTKDGPVSSGTEKYCFKVSSLQAWIQYEMTKVIPSIFLTILIEIPLFIVFISKKRRPIAIVTLLNIISVTALHLILASVSTTSIPLILLLEIGVIVFEIWGVLTFAKVGKPKQITLFVIGANIASAVLGTLLLAFLNRIV